MKHKKTKIALLLVLVLLIVVACFTFFGGKETVKQQDVKKVEAPADEESFEDFSS